MASVLLDTCVWGGVLAPLAGLGHDVIWSGNWPHDPGDTEILRRAHGEKRILVTLDKDFGELAIVKGMPHSGIIRFSSFKTSEMTAVLHHVMSAYLAELEAGASITVDPKRLRIRTP